MDMAINFDEQFAFHLTGRLDGRELEAIDGLNLRPALLAGFHHLAGLRYDYPVVLVEDAGPGTPVRSLSSVIDAVMRQVAPRGIEGERLRKHVLRLEREIRALVARGATGRLSELWALATARIASCTDEATGKVLEHTGEAIESDGEVLDCGAELPARMLEHLWTEVQLERARAFHADAGALAVKLSDILRAAFVRSEEGRRAASLRASVGGPHQEMFDFASMSDLLRRPDAEATLPDARRARIDRALSVLRSQRFFATPRGTQPTHDADPYQFVFDDCASAVEAFRGRLPQLLELAKAMAIAQLEADGSYVEAEHDPLFAAFGAGALGRADMAAFPNYLVRIAPGRIDAPENAMLMEVLASGLPIKVLVQTEEVLVQSAVGEGSLAFGARGAQLASTAIGLDDVFVLQSSSANLLQLQDRIRAGVAGAGPALFSVFSGPSAPVSAFAPYLTAITATQARVFPAFTCDPAGGTDWASRFSLEGNPQPEADWPADCLTYSDVELQRVSETLAFTAADFALCDPRYARHFARAPRSRWNAHMVRAHEWLALDEQTRARRIPYLLAIDADDVLHRIIVDGRLMQATRRCREMWQRLQELGGIHNSHAERLLARERSAWEAQKQRELESLKDAVHADVAASAPAAAAPAPAVAQQAPGATSQAEPVERPSDDPYIETARCSSCNECTQINDRMFVYDANQQAYIADADAGSYRELVEAAENCQLSIIHPGKPRNPAEPGLEELVKRAEPFA